MKNLDHAIDNDALFKDADEAVRIGAFEDARRGYQKILDRFPDHPGALAGIELIDYVEGGRKSRYNLPVNRIPDEIWDRRRENRIRNEEEFRRGSLRVRSAPPYCT